MAKRMLVPMDETVQAERVVDLVADLGRGSGATVRLLRVAPEPGNVESEGRVVAYADQEMTRLESEGLDRLRAIGARLDRIPTECVVRFGDPVREILAEAEAFGADLIVMSTRTASGLSHILLGSVAEQVLRKAPAPVVLYRDAQGAA